MAEVIRMQSVNAKIAQIKAAWDRADEYQHRSVEDQIKADDWALRTGRLLVEFKRTVDHGQWLPTLKKLGRSERRAQELMELAKGSKTVEGERERKRESVEKSRAKARYVARISPGPKPRDMGKMSEAELFAAGAPVFHETAEGVTTVVQDADEEYHGHAPSLEERWLYGLDLLLGDIIARPSYWDKHFPGWEQFDCPSQTRKLLVDAARVLASISATVAKRDRKSS